MTNPISSSSSLQAYYNETPHALLNQAILNKDLGKIKALCEEDPKLKDEIIDLGLKHFIVKSRKYENSSSLELFLEIAQLWIKNNFKIEEYSFRKESLLIKAIDINCSEAILYFIENSEKIADLNNLFIKLISHDPSLEVLEKLLSLGADINAKSSSMGLTALHTAMMEKKDNLAKFLIKKGANLMEKDSMVGCIPFEYNNEFAIEWLKTLPEKPTFEQIQKREINGKKIPHNRELHERDENGKTLLHWAAKKAHSEITKLLMAKGANPNSVDKDGKTPLDYAYNDGNDHICDILLNRRTIVAAIDENWNKIRGYVNDEGIFIEI